MAETLGMLCDKLMIVKLKEFHSEDHLRLESLKNQAIQLQSEIDEYVSAAVNGLIATERLTFASNKVFKKQGNEFAVAEGDIGALFYQLADVNCKLWHEVEKGYDIENVAVAEKDKLVKNLAVLNLQRNQCIDAIDARFAELVKNKIKLS